MRQFAQLLSLHSCSLLQASTAYRCYSVPTAKRLRLLLLGQARELGGLYLLALALLALLPLSLGQLRLLERLEPSQLLCRDVNLLAEPAASAVGCARAASASACCRTNSTASSATRDRLGAGHDVIGGRCCLGALAR